MADRVGQGAVFLAAVLLAAGAAGCEYANDVGPDPSRPSGTGTTAAAGPFPIASVDPELEAELERNMGAVELMMADVPAGAGGAAGGISGKSAAGGGLTYNGVLTNAGTYTVTAACTGAVEAQLVITSRGAAGNSEVIDVPCGEPVRRQLQLGTGPVTAYLVSPDESRVHKAAVGAVRIGSAP